ncbi:MAG TPA: efflux RND transporter periplasmic adaptor subunit, partial [Casimicrobiaceae bacterium]
NGNAPAGGAPASDAGKGPGDGKGSGDGKGAGGNPAADAVATPPGAKEAAAPRERASTPKS